MFVPRADGGPGRLLPGRGCALQAHARQVKARPVKARPVKTQKKGDTLHGPADRTASKPANAAHKGSTHFPVCFL